MKILIFIAAGGAVGAAARYGVDVAVGRAIGHGFPWSTLIVNIVGSLVLGALVEVFALRWSVSPELRALIVIGVMGSFTTFSAFSLDVVTLAERGQWTPAGLYIAASVILSVGGFIAGLRLTRLALA